MIEGHSEHCGFQPTVVREDSSIQTETIPPCSVATATVQVDTPQPPLPIHVMVQTDVPRTIPLAIQDASSQTSPHPGPTPNPTHITSPLPPMSLNWADDAMSLPISLPPILSPPISLQILPSHPPPHDLSILCSLFSKPFSSLQRRNKRRPHFFQPFHNRQSFNIPHQTFSHPRFPPPCFSSTSVRSAQVYPSHTPRFSPPSALNWEGDPRLFELSRALNALGWVRP